MFGASPEATETLDTGQAMHLSEEMDQTAIVCQRERRVHIKK